MDRNTPDNNLLFDDEVNLHQLFEIISSSKSIILIITLLCTFLVSGYAYFIKPTTYVAHAKFVLGQSDSGPSINSTLLETKMNFFFESNFKFIAHNNQFLEIKTSSTNKETLNTRINSLVQYAMKNSEDSQDKFIKSLELNLNSNQRESTIINNTLTSNTNLKPEFMFDLTLRSKSLEDEKLMILKTLSSYTKTELYEPITIAPINKNEKVYVILGLTLGIILSFIIVFLRFSFFQQKHNNSLH